MKRFKHVLVATGIVMALAACGNEEVSKEEDTAAPQTEVEEDASTIVKQEEVASLADPRLQEPTEDTICEMCNMKVYTKEHELGVFSAQAIKADGSIAFYDDIGCLLNAELANNEENDKYVRDYNTLDWALVEDVTIVKTEIKSPMNWGYIYFVDKADADKYIEENPTAHVEELQTIKDAAKKRREEKMKNMAEEGSMDMNHSDESNMDDSTMEEDHNH
ncbi:nitrous oxide reductase accessory protein NosL [Lysinibacillus sp. LZ02]|uniref:nitrous oxide reductase accessory protein NosL n=1 Tax=Lysinibacillus sp. LZ02 TaxID=3420668 RepID=UPI003D35CFBE